MLKRYLRRYKYSMFLTTLVLAAIGLLILSLTSEPKVVVKAPEGRTLDVTDCTVQAVVRNETLYYFVKCKVPASKREPKRNMDAINKNKDKPMNITWGDK